MSSARSVRRALGALAAAGALAVGPVGFAFGSDVVPAGASAPDEVVVDPDVIGEPVTEPGPASGGGHDAGPTPPNAGDPPEGDEQSDERGAGHRQTAATPGAGDDDATQGRTSSADSDSSVEEVRLARTGFALLPLGTVAFLAILTGVGVVRARRG
jgi:hypothetical protein